MRFQINCGLCARFSKAPGTSARLNRLCYGVGRHDFNLAMGTELQNEMCKLRIFLHGQRQREGFVPFELRGPEPRNERPFHNNHEALHVQRIPGGI